MGHGSDASHALPTKKTPVEIFADFLRYLYDCTRKYIREMHTARETVWSTVEDNIDYVITHPNGWEGFQQA